MLRTAQEDEHMSTIRMKHGTEGPKFDPWGYDEMIVKRPNGDKVTLHRGLAIWCSYEKADGRKWKEDGIKAEILFATSLGVRPYAMDRAYGKLLQLPYKLHHLKCGNENLISTTGYPGESFEYCSKCGEHLGYHFDRSAVE